MRKTPLPKREREICARFKQARIDYGGTQEKVASIIAIERTTLANYERAVTPLRWDVALRFCRSIIVSEEWLATGHCEAARRAAIAQGFPASTDWRLFETFFKRLSMDLLSEPECAHFPRVLLFSDVYDNRLADRYASLALKNFYAPRILLTDADPPRLASALLDVDLHKWFTTLNRNAQRTGKNPFALRRALVKCLQVYGHFIQLRLMGVDLNHQEKQQLDWIVRSLDDPLQTVFGQAGEKKTP